MTKLLGPKGKQIEDHSLEVADLPLGTETGEMLLTNGNEFQIKKHADITETEGIHQIYNFNFASVTDMNNYAAVATDIGKVAKVGVDYYVLTNNSPVTWDQVNTPPMNVDGGSASSVYTSDQNINGGTA